MEFFTTTLVGNGVKKIRLDIENIVSFNDNDFLFHADPVNDILTVIMEGRVYEINYNTIRKTFRRKINCKEKLKKNAEYSRDLDNWECRILYHQIYCKNKAVSAMENLEQIQHDLCFVKKQLTDMFVTNISL